MAAPNDQPSQGSKSHYSLTGSTSNIPKTFEWSEREQSILEYAVNVFETSSGTFYQDVARMIPTKSVTQIMNRCVQTFGTSVTTGTQNSSGVTALANPASTNQAIPQNRLYWNAEEQQFAYEGPLQCVDMTNPMGKMEHYGQRFVDAQNSLLDFTRQREQDVAPVFPSVTGHNSAIAQSQSVPRSFSSSERSSHSTPLHSAASSWPVSSSKRKEPFLYQSRSKIPATESRNVTSSFLPYSQMQTVGTLPSSLPPFSTTPALPRRTNAWGRTATIPNRPVQPSVPVSDKHYSYTVPQRPFPTSGNGSFSSPQPTNRFVHHNSGTGNGINISPQLMPELQPGPVAYLGNALTFPSDFKGKGIATEQPSSSLQPRPNALPDSNWFASQCSPPAVPTTWNGGQSREGPREVPVSHGSTGHALFGQFTNNGSGWQWKDAAKEFGVRNSQQLQSQTVGTSGFASQCVPPANGSGWQSRDAANDFGTINHRQLESQTVASTGFASQCVPPVNGSGWQSRDAANEFGMINHQHLESQTVATTGFASQGLPPAIQTINAGKDSFEFSLHNQAAWQLDDIVNGNTSSQQLNPPINQTAIGQGPSDWFNQSTAEQGVPSGSEHHFVGEANDSNGTNQLSSKEGSASVGLPFDQLHIWNGDQSQVNSGQLVDLGVNHTPQVDSQENSNDNNWFYNVNRTTEGESTSSQQTLNEFQPANGAAPTNDPNDVFLMNGDEEYNQMMREGFTDIHGHC